MNHKQINDLYKFDHWRQYWISDKRGVWFELKEKYIYGIDFLGSDSPMLEKGSRLKFKCMTLDGWKFELETPIQPFGNEMVFGRSRLLKMKLKELSIDSDIERSCETCLHKEKTDQEKPCCYCGGALPEWTPTVRSDTLRTDE